MHCDITWNSRWHRKQGDWGDFQPSLMPKDTTMRVRSQRNMVNKELQVLQRRLICTKANQNVFPPHFRYVTFENENDAMKAYTFVSSKNFKVKNAYPFTPWLHLSCKVRYTHALVTWYRLIGYVVVKSNLGIFDISKKKSKIENSKLMHKLKNENVINDGKNLTRSAKFASKNYI